MKKEEAIKDIRKYGQHKYSLIYKVQGQYHSAINLDWRNQDGYKDAFQDGDLIKCLELLENVCSTHHCSKFKYAPMETVRLVQELSLYKQGSLPLDVYEKQLKSRVRALTVDGGPHPLGTSYLFNGGPKG